MTRRSCSTKTRDLLEAFLHHDGAELAAWHARIIAGYYAHHYTAAAGHDPADDTLMADGIIRWHQQTGAKIVYWGGSGHTSIHRR